MKYVINKNTDYSEWDKFVSLSKQGSVFSQYKFLKALGVPFTIYMVKIPSGKFMAGVVVLEDENKMQKTPFPYTPYQGILFGQEIELELTYKREYKKFHITQFLIKELLKIYGNFNMIFSPEYKDMRPFLWHNYGELNNEKFKVDIRSTGILEFNDLSFEKYLNGHIRTVRRQEYIKSKANINQTKDVEKFVEKYINMFSQKNVKLTSQEVNIVRSISLNSLTQNFGVMTQAVCNDEIASMALFLFDNDTAYYMFGVNDYNYRNTNSSTKIIIENIKYFWENGIKKIDFVGVNSPNRGDFKLSFGANLVNYFNVELKNL